MAIPLFILGATIIRTAAPSIIRALTKQGAKKIAKPSAKQIKNAVSPKNAPKKIQDAIKPKPTGTAARKARRSKTGDSTSKSPADAARKKQTDQLKQGNGARKAQPPKKKPTTTAKKPTTTAKKPTKKPDPKKKPTTTTKPDTGLTPSKVAGGLAGGVGTLAGATVLGGADKKARDTRDKGLSSLSKSGMGFGTKRKAERRTDRQSDASRSARPSGRTDSDTVGTKQKERQATLPPREKEGMGGKATVSPNQKSRQATLPKEEGIGTKIARALGDKRSEEEMIRTRKMNEEDEKEMGMNKGGAVKKKYGMREGGFTKRGGMYKKGY